MRVLDMADPALPDIWAVGVREFDAERAMQSSTERVTTNLGWNDRIGQELVHQLHSTRPAIAGEMGCNDVGRPQYPNVESLVAIAKRENPCSATTKMTERMTSEASCNPNLSCTGFVDKLHLCTPQEFESKIDGFVKAPFDPYGGGVTREMAILVAGRALRIVPMEFSLRLDRAVYTIDMPVSPDCREAMPGTPCHCGELADRPLRALCEVQADATEGNAWTCRYRIDDKAKQVMNAVVRKPN